MERAMSCRPAEASLQPIGLRFHESRPAERCNPPGQRGRRLEPNRNQNATLRWIRRDVRSVLILFCYSRASIQLLLTLLVPARARPAWCEPGLGTHHFGAERLLCAWVLALLPGKAG